MRTILYSLTLCMLTYSSSWAQAPANQQADTSKSTSQTAPAAAAPATPAPATPAPTAKESTVPAKVPTVLLKTSMGEITVELAPSKAPVTVENFTNYVKSGYYNGTIFHRVINGFMIQGGGFNADLQKKSTRDPIKLEAKKGTI